MAAVLKSYTAKIRKITKKVFYCSHRTEVFMRYYNANGGRAHEGVRSSDGVTVFGKNVKYYLMHAPSLLCYKKRN